MYKNGVGPPPLLHWGMLGGCLEGVGRTYSYPRLVVMIKESVFIMYMIGEETILRRYKSDKTINEM